MTIFKSIMGTIVMSGFACGAHAVDFPGGSDGHSVEVGGDITMNGSVDQLIALAVSEDSLAVAGQNVVFESTKVDGNINMRGDADTIIGLAVGKRARAISGQNMLGAPKK